MALNPPTNGMGEPLRVQNEHYILQRHGIEFEVKIDGMGKLKGKGSCILTSNRIILKNDKGKSSDQLKNFDIPHQLTFKDSFEQPIFGANYIKGNCKPLQPGSLPGDCAFKMWFMEGGCGKFLKSWRFCLFKMRQAARAQQQQQQQQAQNQQAQWAAAEAALVQQLQGPQFQRDFALFDPNDPSTIFVNQPPVHAPNAGAKVHPWEAQQPGGPPNQAPAQGYNYAYNNPSQDPQSQVQQPGQFGQMPPPPNLGQAQPGQYPPAQQPEYGQPGQFGQMPPPQGQPPAQQQDYNYQFSQH